MMKKNILIIGGGGLVGNKITQMLKSKDAIFDIFAGGRKDNGSITNFIPIDVNNLSTFINIAKYNIHLVVLCTNDQSNNVLNYCIENKLDYLDITKPTIDLKVAYKFSKDKKINSRIVFGSGWMGGLVPGLVSYAKSGDEIIEAVKLSIYYSNNDLSGKSSTGFLAENISKRFKFYKQGKTVWAKYFMNIEKHNFGFEIGEKQCSNFDTPDLFILNRIEGIPTIEAKIASNATIVTLLLSLAQKIDLFKILPLSLRKLIFASNGKGDQTAFEITIRTVDQTKVIRLRDILGQANLTAFITVLNIEKILQESSEGIFFSHQLFKPNEFYNLLKRSKSINIEEGIL